MANEGPVPGSSPGPRAGLGTLGRGLSAFGRFWWGFLVGDTPEILVGVLLVVGAAFLLRHDRVAAVVMLPVLAVALLALTTVRGRRRAGG